MTSSDDITPTEIIFEYVCPILGMIIANFMFAAPLKDLQTAVSIGLGLGDLNPTPFAFMLGNCIGWTTYGVITNNWFIFWANYPGFLIACWLNLGAVKLLYSHHHQKVARTSIVNFLNSNASSSTQSSRSTTNIMGGLEFQNNDDNNNHNNNYNSDKVNNDNGNDNANDNDNDKIESSSIDYGYDENTTDTTQQSQITTTTTQNQNGDPNEDWAKIIWDVTSQTKPARTPHERLVMGIILIWTIVLSLIGFLGHYNINNNDSDENTTNNGDTTTTTTTGGTTTIDLAQMIVGYVVNFNLVFFYGAPLSAINQVIKTKRNNTLHVPTMITNTSCAIFWTAYAVAPQINDPFIYVPNGLGVLLGIIQFVLWTVFPTTTTTTTTTTTNKKQEQESDDNNLNHNGNELLSSGDHGHDRRRRRGGLQTDDDK